MADFRVASEKAKFGELFVLRGLVSDVAGLGRLAQLVGREKAAELLIHRRGHRRRRGAADRPRRPCGPSRRAAADRPRARRSASPRTRPSPCRRSSAGCARRSTPTGTKLGVYVSRRSRELFQTEDHREGVRSFLEKRAPEIHRELTLPLAALSPSSRPADRAERRRRRTRARTAHPSRPDRTRRSAAGRPSPTRSPSRCCP